MKDGGRGVPQKPPPEWQPQNTVSQQGYGDMEITGNVLYGPEKRAEDAGKTTWSRSSGSAAFVPETSLDSCPVGLTLRSENRS